MGVRTFTTGALTDAAVGTGVRISFEVLDKKDPLVQAIRPANKNSPKVKDRLFYRVFTPEVVNGTPSGRSVGTDLAHVSAAVTGASGAQVSGLRQLLKLLHDKAIIDLDLA